MPWPTLIVASVAVLSATSIGLGEAAGLNFDNFVSANLDGLYTSKYLYFTESDFRKVIVNGTAFELGALGFNMAFVLGGVYLLSLLPETAFCAVRGTCTPGYGYGTYAKFYRNRFRNHHLASNREDEYFYPEEEEYIYSNELLPRSLGPRPRGRRPFSRRRRPGVRRLGKRDVDIQTPVSQEEFINTLEEDLSTLPAEHRQIGVRPRQSFMEYLADLFFGRPIRRVSNSWANLYDHYEEYWRFRLANGPDANFARYKAKKRARLAHQRRRQQQQQHRQRFAQREGEVAE